jgi:protein-tyrosine phosphatase
MLDFHTHILPNIDDGAPDLATGVAMCRTLQQQGIQTVVATPHWPSPRFEVVDPAIERAWEALHTAVAQQVPGLALVLGAEHHCSGVEATEAFVGAVKPLGDSNLVLIELPDDHLPPAAWATLFALIRADFRPILAHPERSRGLRNQREQLSAFVDAGGLLQLTLGSLLGKLGWAMRWQAHGLLRRHPGACLLASDSHDLQVRKPQWDLLPAKWRYLVPSNLAELCRWGMCSTKGNV